MRNIFDQYTQPENRLTHALVSAMAEDDGLLRRFVKWITGSSAPGRLQIVEQRLPGENELAELDYERRGLPDAWIHDGDEWSLLVESKVQAPLNVDQLQRHYRTAQRRGYVDVTVLAIDIAAPSRRLPEYVVFRPWKEIYHWLYQQSDKSEWAQRTLRYMDVVESKWPVEGYLREGTLTEFAGIHFDDQNPYNYGEAKRLIKLIMEELRLHPALQGFIDTDGAGRGAIKGRYATSVWDYLRLLNFYPDERFNQHPHLTLSIAERQVSPILLLPNAMETRYRRKLTDMGEDSFRDVMRRIEKNMRKVSRSAPGAKPWVGTSQRHHVTRSSTATIDGDINFDLRTAFENQKSPIKYQPQWLSASYSLVTQKKSNMSFSVGVRMPYEDCPKLKKRAILDSIAASWIACSPLLDALAEA